MTAEQKRVAAGMASAAAFSALFVGAGYLWAPFALPPLPTVGARIAFALRCDIFAMLTLLVGIGWVARRRFFSDGIDGARGSGDGPLDIDMRYVTNTAEQCVLLVPAHLALATVSEGALRAVPVLVVLFVIGRMAFWIGYHRDPVSRAFGFATSFYPTVAVYLFVIWRNLAPTGG